MKVRTSVTVAQEVLEAADEFAAAHGSNRSALVEEALVAFLRTRAREEQDRQDLAIIEANADRLNEETLDSLTFQEPEP